MKNKRLSPLANFFKSKGLSDRGAAFVELAVVVPLLAGLFLGVIEFGSAWRESALLQRMTSQTARTVSSLGTNPNADRQALTTVVASINSTNRLSFVPGTTDRVVVYNANPGSVVLTEPPEECLTTDAPKVGNVCNIYSPTSQDPEVIFTALEQYNSNQLYFPSSCDTPYDAWCGSQRNWFTTNPNEKIPYVGVYIQATYSSLTGVIPDRQISANAIYQMEPCTVIRQDNQIVNTCPI